MTTTNEDLSKLSLKELLDRLLDLTEESNEETKETK